MGRAEAYSDTAEHGVDEMVYGRLPHRFVETNESKRIYEPALHPLGWRWIRSGFAWNGRIYDLYRNEPRSRALVAQAEEPVFVLDDAGAFTHDDDPQELTADELIDLWRDLPDEIELLGAYLD